jgi:hypothetical protein
MTPASDVFKACEDLYAEYPMAASPVNSRGTVYAIVLTLCDGADARYFTLARYEVADGHSYVLSPWRSDHGVTIRTDSHDVADLAVAAVMRGVPMPRDGSMFGWTCGGTVAALVLVHTSYTPQSPVPTWSAMSLADGFETQWPPFIGESSFGPWFWDHYRAGKLISIGGLVAANPGCVFWVDAYATIGTSCCVVTNDLEASGGPILGRGRYVDSRALMSGQLPEHQVPSMAELLAGNRTDLAPLFERGTHDALK